MSIPFYFISVPRVASNSIHTALKSNTINYHHVPAKIMRRRVGKKAWKEAFTFGGVRHPLARLVSWFAFCRMYKMAMYMPYTFAQWVEAGCPHHHRIGHSRLTSDKPLSLLEFLADEQGKVLVDFVYRFEQLQKDFKEICRRLGRKPVKLPRLAKGETGNYRKWYTPALKRTAEKLCRADLEAFYSP